MTFASPVKSFVKDLAMWPICPVNIIWHGNLPGKQLALTFDDGPDPVHTPRILEALARLNICATFFLLGSKIKMHPEIVRDIISSGHEVGNHSYNHNVYDVFATKDIASEIERSNLVLEETVNIETKMFRPPFGKLSFPLIAYCLKKNLMIVMWSFDCRDSFGRNSRSNADMPQKVRANDIVLMHDDDSRSLNLVNNQIPPIIDKGFTFVRLSEMISSRKKLRILRNFHFNV